MECLQALDGGGEGTHDVELQLVPHEPLKRSLVQLSCIYVCMCATRAAKRRRTQTRTQTGRGCTVNINFQVSSFEVARSSCAVDDTLWGCNQPKKCAFPFSFLAAILDVYNCSTTRTAWWCSKTSVHKTGDIYITCNCANVLANPDPLALNLCFGSQSSPQGPVMGFYTSPGVASQDCSTNQCSAVRSTWTGTYSTCRTVVCSSGPTFTSQNNSLTACSAASAMAPSPLLVFAAAIALLSLKGANS